MLKQKLMLVMLLLTVAYQLCWRMVTEASWFH